MSSRRRMMYGIKAAVAAVIARNYARFNGGGSYISIPNAAHNNPSEISILLWVRWDTSGNRIIIEKSSNNTNYLMHTNDAGQLYFGVGSPGFQILFSPVLNDGLWHPVMATYSATTQNGQIYADGALADSGTLGLSAASSTEPWNLGSRGGGAPFAGDESGLRLYNRVLSLSEYEDFIAGTPPTSGLIGAYELNGNANDSSGYANHGTAYSGVVFGSD